MIQFIPGYSGAVVDIQTDDEILEGVGILIEQTKVLDEGHPWLPELEKLYEQFKEELE